MAELKTELAYNVARARVEELRPFTGKGVSVDDPHVVEMVWLRDLIDEYEKAHFMGEGPTLGEKIKCRMQDMHVNQSQLSAMLHIHKPRLSDIIHDKAEPTIGQLKKICRVMSLDPTTLLDL